jgi:hypothetical protein
MPFFKARGKSKKAMRRAVGKNMHSLKHGPHHKDRTRKQEIAIAFKEARGKRKAKRGKKRGARRR